MKVAIDQPNYLPWKGYFDLIHDVDLFVFYNDVQYTSRDWRSRNKIVTPDGVKWLSVPAGSNRERLICDVKLVDKNWQRKHLETLRFAYSKSPYFKKYFPFFEDVYLKKEWDYLHELDQYLIEKISRDFLGIETEFADSKDYPKSGVKHAKLLSLVDSLGGWTLMSPAQLQRIILFLMIIKVRELNLCGRTMLAIQYIHNSPVNLSIKFLLLTYSLMSGKKLLIISGDGENTVTYQHIQKTDFQPLSEISLGVAA